MKKNITRLPYVYLLSGVQGKTTLTASVLNGITDCTYVLGGKRAGFSTTDEKEVGDFYCKIQGITLVLSSLGNGSTTYKQSKGICGWSCAQDCLVILRPDSGTLSVVDCTAFESIGISEYGSAGTGQSYGYDTYINGAINCAVVIDKTFVTSTSYYDDANKLVGFTRCFNLVGCQVHSFKPATSAHDTRMTVTGFSGCSYLVNCIASVHAYLTTNNMKGFHSCRYLSNCLSNGRYSTSYSSVSYASSCVADCSRISDNWVDCTYVNSDTCPQFLSS